MKFRCLLLVTIVTVSGSVLGQDDRGDWTVYKPARSVDTLRVDSTVADPSETLLFVARSDSDAYFDPHGFLNFDTNKVGTVKVETSAALDATLKSMGTVSPPNQVKIDGYRVQVFFDQDRGKVMAAKKRFLIMNPEMEAYVEWHAPYHYLRVGDFYTEQRALKAVQELKAAFPTSTIYKSRINLPNLGDEYPGRDDDTDND